MVRISILACLATAVSCAVFSACSTLPAAQSSQDHSAAQPPAPPTGPVNVNNGVQIGFGQLGGPPQANPKAWFCSVQAFTSTFEAFGPTQLEAHQRTLQDCVRQYNPMRCEDIKCRVNQ